MTLRWLLYPVSVSRKQQLPIPPSWSVILNGGPLEKNLTNVGAATESLVCLSIYFLIPFHFLDLSLSPNQLSCLRFKTLSRHLRIQPHQTSPEFWLVRFWWEAPVTAPTVALGITADFGPLLRSARNLLSLHTRFLAGLFWATKIIQQPRRQTHAWTPVHR